MSEEFERAEGFVEPPVDHLADTNPIRPIGRAALPLWRRVIGLISLIGAAGLTAATAFLLITAPTETEAPAGGSDSLPTAAVQITALPPTQTSQPPTQPQNFVNIAPVNAVLPTLDPARAGEYLASPLQPAGDSGIELVRNNYDPFTIIPDRPRSEVIQYEVQAGDTIFSIAERFGLKPETIAWSNDRSIIGGLRPGRLINILPVDGAYYTVPAQETIEQIARRFGVDPYVIIDSEFNDLFGATPDTLLSSGTSVVVPGGEAEQITWNPVVERVGGDASRGNTGGQISFAPGDPGSCGLVDNPGGGGGWVNPLGAGTYTWTRGFTSWHTGVDLSAPTGTPVKAANGGTVIFAGWNSYGYGYAIVLAHGPFTTVYGHLSAINVGCRQYVNAGQVIGAVGSTGNSSGPHLHFEIRYNDVPTDPTGTMPL